MDTVREKFEAWFSDDGLSPKAIERSGDDYKLMQAQSAWRTWQAAFASTQGEIAELRKAVLTREERWAALRWLDVTRLYAFTEPVDDALAAKLEAQA